MTTKPKPVATLLARAAFSTSRLAEFASIKGLTTQTGHGSDEWPLVIIKELIDNGVDAAETIGVQPVIAIAITGNTIAVTDNGGGISPDDVARMLDYTQRVSTNEAYASPTRGQQGNAIQTVLAMPFVLDGQRGETTIESRAVKHSVVFEVDAVRQVPRVAAAQAKSKFVQSGTRVTVRWPNSASSELAETRPQIVQIARDYATLNPHLAISLVWDGRKEVNIKASDPAWTKWLPLPPIGMTSNGSAV